MGRFLCIGIKTRIIVERSDLQTYPPGETSAQTIIERNLVDSELYDLTITDNKLIYSLKEEIVGKEWIAFLKEFYDMRYEDARERIDNDDAIECNSTTRLSVLGIVSSTTGNEILKNKKLLNINMHTNANLLNGYLLMYFGFYFKRDTMTRI